MNHFRCSLAMELSLFEMLFSWQRRNPPVSSLLMKLMPLEQNVSTGMFSILQFRLMPVVALPFHLDHSNFMLFELSFHIEQWFICFG
jgi:hypothetical protein